MSPQNGCVGLPRTDSTVRFSSMVHELKGSETVLTGLLQDRSAVFSVLAEVEALGLELLELRQLRPRRNDLG
jgi:hypothetical protein